MTSQSLQRASLILLALSTIVVGAGTCFYGIALRKGRHSVADMTEGRIAYGSIICVKGAGRYHFRLVGVVSGPKLHAESAIRLNEPLDMEGLASRISQIPPHTYVSFDALNVYEDPKDLLAPASWHDRKRIRDLLAAKGLEGRLIDFDYGH